MSTPNNYGQFAASCASADRYMHERRTDGAHCAVAPGSGLDAPGTLADRLKTLMSCGLTEAQNAAAIDELTMGKLLRWYDAGCGSGSHLAETLAMPPSGNLRALANILACAKDSQEVQRMLAALSE